MMDQAVCVLSNGLSGTDTSEDNRTTQCEGRQITLVYEAVQK